MKRLLAGLFALAPLAAAQDASPKSDLRVLLVGHDPEAPRITFDGDDERTRALYAERTDAFRALLETHFETVEVVFGAAYDASMSGDVDVTLFDCVPDRLPTAETGDVPPVRRYLPDDFSKPALMIAENSSLIGEPLGSKLDWL